MITIGEGISRVRRSLKAVKLDAFMTDRHIYSMMLRATRFLIRRMDAQNKLMMFKTLFQTINRLELIEVDRVEAKCKCYDVESGCKFKRTKEKLPPIFDGYWGPMIRTVSSIDGMIEVNPTYRTSWEKMSSLKTFKYNKSQYYWYQDGYLYFPNLEWDEIMIEAMFEEDVSNYGCEDECINRKDQRFMVPSGLHEEVEKMIMQDLGFTLQIPPDQQHDNKNAVR